MTEHRIEIIDDPDADQPLSGDIVWQCSCGEEWTGGMIADAARSAAAHQIGENKLAELLGIDPADAQSASIDDYILGVAYVSLERRKERPVINTTVTSAAPAAADLAGAVAVLHAGMTYLAAVCDYAEERDGAGFSATDAGIGHFLAELNPGRWEQVHVVTARAVLPTYRRQLGPELTAQILAIPTSVDEDEITESRSTVRGQGRAARERKYRARNSHVALELEEGRVRVGFPYNEALVAQSRAIPGRRYDGQTRSNTYPLSSLPAVIGFATKADIPVDPPLTVHTCRRHPQGCSTSSFAAATGLVVWFARPSANVLRRSVAERLVRKLGADYRPEDEQ